MSVFQTKATLNPLKLSTGAEVNYQDAQAVIEQANYSFTVMPSLGSTVAGGDDWVTGAKRTLDIQFRAAATGFVEVLRWTVEVPTDASHLVMEATCDFAGSDTGDVRFKLNGSTVYTMSFTSSDTSLQAIASVSPTGNAEPFTIEIDRTAGTTTAHLVDVHVEVLQRQNALPSPVLE